MLLCGGIFTGLNATITLHEFNFNDTAGTSLQDAANTGTIGGAFTNWNNAVPTAVTTGNGTLRITYNGNATENRLTTGITPVPTEVTLYQQFTIAGWNFLDPSTTPDTNNQPQVRFSFINDPGFGNSANATELRFTRLANGDVAVDAGTGTSFTTVDTLTSLQTDPLTYLVEFNRLDAAYTIYQLQPDDSWSTLVSGTPATTSSLTRDALSSRIWVTGSILGDGTGYFDIDSFSVSAIPEPRTYALLLGLAGLGLVIYRRLKVVK